MNVLSLCDGISTGQFILNKLGIKVENYFASEIEESAKLVAKDNFPNTIDIGDIFKISYKDGVLYTEKGNYTCKIDLILSGTPCVSFSVAGKKENMNGVSGDLFKEFARVLKEVNPTYFFFENVKMSEFVAEEINKELGVKYIYLNSVDFGCHIRKRYYWTNIEQKEPYTKVNKNIEDILEDLEFDCNVSDYTVNSPYNVRNSREGIICINPKTYSGKQTNQRGRIYDIRGKCPTICATLFDLKITEDHKKYRKLTITECERLQGLSEGYTKAISRSKAGKALGNGWQADTVMYLLSGLV